MAITSLSQLTQSEIRASRLAASADLYFYARWMFLANKRRVWQRAIHHAIVCQVLEDVFYGRRRNVIINIAPRYSKTELAVVNFVSWAFGKVPDAEFIHTSYGSPLAIGNSARVRDMMQTQEYQEVFPRRFEGVNEDGSARLVAPALIDPYNAGKEHWKTTEGGVFYAAGAGGSITGFGAGKMDTERIAFGGAIIIDDPHKPDEALSKQMREGVFEWYQNTVESRRNDPMRTPIIVIMQRLHVEDLAGKLARGDAGEHFDVISIPALHGGQRDEEETVTVMVNGTPVEVVMPAGSFRDGDTEALWPEKHTVERLQQMDQANGYVFAGQYRQKPAPLSGGFFKPDLITKLPLAPLNVRKRKRGWDLAATEGKGDWTVGGLIGMQENGRPIILDIKRDRAGPDKVDLLLSVTAKNDRSAGIEQSLPQDPGQAGKSQISHFAKMLAGCIVHSSTESGDKDTRAQPFASQVNLGQVDMVEAPWNSVFIEELRMYPNGTNDDQVDALARAYNRMCEGVDHQARLEAMTN
jgi:predicted phage terminase large subunit-like protein